MLDYALVIYFNTTIMTTPCSFILNIQPEGLLVGIDFGEPDAENAHFPAQQLVLPQYDDCLDADDPGILDRSHGSQTLGLDGGGSSGSVPVLFFVGDLPIGTSRQIDLLAQDPQTGSGSES